MDNATVASSASSPYWISTPQTSEPIPALYPILEPAAHIASDTPPTLPTPHPSIFELIQPDSESLPSIATPGPYIITPAIVPDHVWQAELAREHLRNYERLNVAEPSRRTRISAPYFIRTPLILKKPRRGKKAAAKSFTPYCDPLRLKSSSVSLLDMFIDQVV